jgi:outer membrane cobalamin receptor
MFRSTPDRPPVPPARSAAAVALVLLPLAALATPAAAQVTSRVRVEVREADTGRPLPDVEVELVGVGRAAWTGPDGQALLRGIPEGRHTLRSRHLGFAPTETVVEVENGVTVEAVLRLHPRPMELAGLDVAVDGLPPGARTVSVEEVGAEARTLADLVERAPGVTVVRRGGPGAPAVPTIRGSSGDQVLVLVDGVALNSPLTGEADLSEVDLSTVERVVVVPGARAGRFGPRALAGAVLVETRRARSSRMQGAMEAGNLGVLGLRGSASLASPGGEWTVSAGGDWNRTEGAFEYPVPEVRGGGVTTRENAGVRTASGFVQGVWEPTEGARLRLRVHGRDAERGSPGTIVQPSLTGHHEQRRIGAVLRAEAGDAAEGWTAMVGGDEHRALFADPDPPFGPSYRSDVRVRQVEARGEARRVRGALEVAAGLDGRVRRIRATTLEAGAPDRIAGAGAWLRGRWRAGRPDRRFVEVSATLRGDVHDLLDGVVASPSLSVLLGHGATSLEASVGSSLSPPDLSDLFFQEGVLAEANPELAPERVRGEVGLELRQRLSGDGWEGVVGVAGFRADIQGMILWFPDFRFVWSPENVDVRRRGLEVDGELRAGALSSLRAGVSWTQVRYDGAVLDGQVVYRPGLTADASARLSLAGAGWSARWRWVGPRRTSPGTDLNELPGYGRLDLGVALPVRLGGMTASVELGVENVLDDPAALLVDYPLPGRTFVVRARLGSPLGGGRDR